MRGGGRVKDKSVVEEVLPHLKLLQRIQVLKDLSTTFE
jgi:hypothetical protein